MTKKYTIPAQKAQKGEGHLPFQYCSYCVLLNSVKENCCVNHGNRTLCQLDTSCGLKKSTRVKLISSSSDQKKKKRTHITVSIIIINIYGIEML